jgi:ketosteroid isomerase-like protein
MRTSVLSLLVAVIGFSPGAARADAHQEVDRAEDARYEAMFKADRAALAALLADEFNYHQPTGGVASKASFIEQVMSGEIKMSGAKRHDVTIHVNGIVATAMGMTRVSFDRPTGPVSFELRYLNVWVQRDGRWQLLARQSAVAPAPPKEPPASKDAPAARKG